MMIWPQGAPIRVELDAFLASDHATPATGKTIAVTISKNGGAFANPNAGATNATQIGHGCYYVDLDATDTDTLGPLKVRGTNADIDDVLVPALYIFDTPTVQDIVTGVWEESLPGGYASGEAGFIVGALLVRLGQITVKKNQALPNFPFVMFGTNGSPKTGLTVSAQRSIDGGAFASAANAVTEIAYGWYQIDMDATDLDGDTIGWRMSAPGAKDTNFTVPTQQEP